LGTSTSGPAHAFHNSVYRSSPPQPGKKKSQKFPGKRMENEIKSHFTLHLHYSPAITTPLLLLLLFLYS